MHEAVRTDAVLLLTDTKDKLKDKRPFQQTNLLSLHLTSNFLLFSNLYLITTDDGGAGLP